MFFFLNVVIRLTRAKFHMAIRLCVLEPFTSTIICFNFSLAFQYKHSNELDTFLMSPSSTSVLTG